MSALTDLQTAVQDVSNAITAAVAKLRGDVVSATDVEAAASALEAAAKSLNDAVNQQAPVTPPPTA